MEQNKRLKISVLIGLLVMIALFALFFVVNGTGDSDSSSFVPFIPIWVAVFVPILAQKRKTEQEKAKREAEEVDIYKRMERLVDRLNDDELAYLQRSLYEAYGDVLLHEYR